MPDCPTTTINLSQTAGPAPGSGQHAPGFTRQRLYGRFAQDGNTECLMLTMEDLQKFAELMSSGELEEQFHYSSRDRQYEILDLLEKLMDVAEIADATATRLIFKDAYLEMVTGEKAQK